MRYGYGASEGGIHRGVMGEVREVGQGEAWDGKVVVVELAPVAKGCEVDRIMD